MMDINEWFSSFPILKSVQNLYWRPSAIWMSMIYSSWLYIHQYVGIKYFMCILKSNYFEMSISFPTGTVHYFQFFHCLLVVGSTHMTSILQFASSTARSWHCVLWWLVIVLADEWLYIFLCWLSCFPVSKMQCTSWLFNHAQNGRTLCTNLDWSILAFSLWLRHWPCCS
jgi:hypothetical protein